MAFAQPAVKDNFLYNGDLFVDVGNLNRHKRASVAEITEVLRPDLKKPRNAAGVKDPVGHWYEAQLIHYGLPPSKDKARAKMRLLENLNQSKLKAKAQYKQSMQIETPSTKKRKNTGDQNPFPTINVNINVGEATLPNRDSPSPPKKRKPQTARRGGSTSVPPPELSHAAFQRNAPVAEVSKPRPKQTARRSASSSLSYRSHTASSHVDSATMAPHANAAFDIVNQYPSPQKNVKFKKEPKPATKKETKVKQEPLAKKELKVKAEPGSKKKTVASSSRSSVATPLGLIN
ncbi:MAG: hypothetical protein L6R42_004631, partial [Xanthoria sp. 1 TBL-2021]